VLHCCIPNLPGVVARTSTHAYQNAAWPYILQIATEGIDAALHNNPSLQHGLATHRGQLHIVRPLDYPTPAAEDSNGLV
jgi:alanine dehydrogenase